MQNIWILGSVVLLSNVASAESKTPVVFVEEIKQVTLADELTYPARVISEVNAAVIADVDGVITQIRTPLGRSIGSGQTVLVMTHTDPVYNYAPVQVIAPVGGVVGSLDVTIGSRVSKGQKLATITDPKRIRVVTEIAAVDLDAMRPGLKGVLTTNGSQAQVEVEMVGVSPVVDTATGTATAELRVRDGQKTVLPPGLVGRIIFSVRERQGYEIAENAVVYRGKETFIRIIEKDKAKSLPVTVGRKRRGMIEVSGDFKNGAEIVVRTSGYVADGEKVTVQKSDVAQKS